MIPWARRRERTSVPGPTPSAAFPCESVLPIRLRPDFRIVFMGCAGRAEHRLARRVSQSCLSGPIFSGPHGCADPVQCAQRIEFAQSWRTRSHAPRRQGQRVETERASKPSPAAAREASERRPPAPRADRQQRPAHAQSLDRAALASERTPASGQCRAVSEAPGAAAHRTLRDAPVERCTTRAMPPFAHAAPSCNPCPWKPC